MKRNERKMIRKCIFPTKTQFRAEKANTSKTENQPKRQKQGRNNLPESGEPEGRTGNKNTPRRGTSEECTNRTVDNPRKGTKKMSKPKTTGRTKGRAVSQQELKNDNLSQHRLFEDWMNVPQAFHNNLALQHATGKRTF